MKKIQPELLTSVQMYRNSVFSLPHLNEEQEQEIIKRARQGEQQARLELMESCLRYVMKVAATFTCYLYYDTYLDLVGVGNLAVVEHVDKALNANNPCGYLRAVAKHAIERYCFTYASLITKTNPRVVQVERLDTPIYDESETTLADVSKGQEPQPELARGDYARLYQALDQLPETYQQVLARHYGLHDQPSESLYEISRDISKKPGPKSCAAYLREYRALRRLRKEFELVSNVSA